MTNIIKPTILYIMIKARMSMYLKLNICSKCESVFGKVCNKNAQICEIKVARNKSANGL